MCVVCVVISACEYRYRQKPLGVRFINPTPQLELWAVVNHLPLARCWESNSGPLVCTLFNRRAKTFSKIYFSVPSGLVR